LRAILLLIEYPPTGFIPQWRAVRELMGFGVGHTMADITGFLALEGDNLVVGRMLDLVSLGIYGRAYQLMNVPASVLGQILDRVLFPAMSKMQSQKEQLALTYFRGTGLIALVMLPMSVVGFLVAPELIRTILGEKWSAVVLPFQIFVIGMWARTSYKMGDSLATATGAVYRRAWRKAIYAALVILGAYFGHFWGAPGCAMGVLVAITVNFILMVNLSLNIIEKSWRDFVLVHLNGFRLGAFAVLGIYPVVTLLRKTEVHPVLLLSLVCIVCALLAFGVWKFAPRFFLGDDGVLMLDKIESSIKRMLGSYRRTSRGKKAISASPVQSVSVETQ